jgi:putative restriction endonuclease
LYVTIGGANTNNIWFTIPAAADYKYAPQTKQWAVFPKLNTPSNKKFKEIFIKSQNQMAPENLGFPPERVFAYYRTIGIDNDTGAWTLLSKPYDMSNIPVSEEIQFAIAWDVFGIKNGVNDYAYFKKKISSYRKDNQTTNPSIGCIVLTNPVFFNEIDWIDSPEDWASNIVTGKKYDTENEIGKRLWDKIEALLQMQFTDSLADEEIENTLREQDSARDYGYSILRRVRIGQSAFRVLVTDAYARRCAISGEKTLPVLEAAHIMAHSSNGPNRTSNGLLLRSDLHKLFDSGYITITNNLNIEVSRKIKEEFQNGKEYYRFHGEKLLAIPNHETEKPHAKFIAWHQNNVFKG